MEEIKTIKFIKNFLLENNIKSLDDISGTNNIISYAKDVFIFKVKVNYSDFSEYDFGKDFEKMSEMNKEVYFFNEDTLEEFEMGLADHYTNEGESIRFVISKNHLNKYFLEENVL